MNQNEEKKRWKTLIKSGISIGFVSQYCLSGVFSFFFWTETTKEER